MSSSIARVRHCLWTIVALLVVAIVGNIVATVNIVAVIRRSMEAHNAMVRREVVGSVSDVGRELETLRVRVQALEVQNR